MNAWALWGDEDERFNLELEKCSVGLDAINETLTFPKRVFHCCIRKLEEPLLKKNKVVTKIQLLGKCDRLVFTNDEELFEKKYFTDQDALEGIYWEVDGVLLESQDDTIVNMTMFFSHLQ